jgi:hypothetical protein
MHTHYYNGIMLRFAEHIDLPKDHIPDDPLAYFPAYEGEDFFLHNALQLLSLSGSSVHEIILSVKKHIEEQGFGGENPYIDLLKEVWLHEQNKKEKRKPLDEREKVNIGGYMAAVFRWNDELCMPEMQEIGGRQCPIVKPRWVEKLLRYMKVLKRQPTYSTSKKLPALLA